MLTPIDTAILPREVRDAGPRARELYGAALSFEQTLVQKLAHTLAESAKDDDSGDATTSMYAEMLPDALSQAVAAGGGLGLAPELYRTMTERYGPSDGGER
jgi:Rod binding domain-containing protein